MHVCKVLHWFLAIWIFANRITRQWLIFLTMMKIIVKFCLQLYWNQTTSCEEAGETGISWRHITALGLIFIVSILCGEERGGKFVTNDTDCKCWHNEDTSVQILQSQQFLYHFTHHFSSQLPLLLKVYLSISLSPISITIANSSKIMIMAAGRAASRAWNKGCRRLSEVLSRHYGKLTLTLW